MPFLLADVSHPLRQLPFLSDEIYLGSCIRVTGLAFV
jgi:hypothetical protein